MTEIASDLRAIRMPEWLWQGAKVKADANGVPVSSVVRTLLAAWLARPEGDTMSSEQLALITASVPNRPGPWERVAAKRIRELGKAGYLTVETAGYADGLRLAGRNLDHAENGGNTSARISAAAAWTRALARIVPAPVDAVTETDDPWQALASELKATSHGER